MIQIYDGLRGSIKKEINEKIHNKLKKFIDYFMDWIDITTNLNENWLYEYVFPKFMLRYKKELCVSVVEDLSEWITDEYHHKLTPVHEYALYKILQYCKSVDKEFLEEQNRSLFGMEYRIEYNDLDNENEEQIIRKELHTFELYETICFEDYDFLGISTFYNMYKNNNVLFEQLGIDIDYYIDLMPPDITQEYIEIKDKQITQESNYNDLNQISGRNIYYKSGREVKKLESIDRREDNMKKNPTVFISYSWDNEKHKEWVRQLWQTLRDNGIDASIDEAVTQQGTTDLNRMMVENIKDNDYVIVVLTEDYAQKSDNVQGGVGLETTFLYNYRQQNPKKIIPIIRSGGNNSIPFYLQGLHYIDFSDDTNISSNFNDLLHRILGINKIEVSELGETPKLGTKKVQPFNLNINNFAENDINEDLIPDFSEKRNPTDLEKNKFIKDSYNEIKSKLSKVLFLTNKKNNEFEYELDEVTQLKSIIRIYLNGVSKYAIKIWVSNGFWGSELSINMAYGHCISDNDNSMNEIIRGNLDKNNKLFLNMTMNSYDRNEYMTSDEVFELLWKNILANIK